MTTKNKQDNEVYILGSNAGNSMQRVERKEPEKNLKSLKKESKRNLTILFCALLGILITSVILFINKKEQAPEYYFEPEQSESLEQDISVVTPDSVNKLKQPPYMEMSEETANGIRLMICTPHHATMSLMVGMPEETDSTIIFAAMAADIRKDNLEIVGDFVLSGKQLARGIAKKGYVAIIDNKITIGVGESTPLLQQAIDHNGSFFRQYPLVNNGELMENKPKNKSVRRALAIRDGQMILVQSRNRESFHDFSRALINSGISDAIYLVGGDAYGWYYDFEHVRHTFGTKLEDIPKNISYIVWR
ncbi:MAG: hypothetical protein LBH77_05290 [Tannerella sp.]|jgi:hypothetical protein|nr:hypothetical protein [Tannerella sp.]